MENATDRALSHVLRNDNLRLAIDCSRPRRPHVAGRGLRPATENVGFKLERLPARDAGGDHACSRIAVRTCASLSEIEDCDQPSLPIDNMERDIVHEATGIVRHYNNTEGFQQRAQSLLVLRMRRDTEGPAGLPLSSNRGRYPQFA